MLPDHLMHALAWSFSLRASKTAHLTLAPPSCNHQTMPLASGIDKFCRSRDSSRRAFSEIKENMKRIKASATEALRCNNTKNNVENNINEQR